jgi:hypothetical protein
MSTRQIAAAAVTGVVSLILVCGCAHGTPGARLVDGIPLDVHTRFCYRDLESYLSKSLTFTTSLEDVRRAGASGTCSAAESGTCDGFRFTRLGDLFVSGTHYFDDSGALIAALSTSDERDEECLGTRYYGRPLTCTEVITANYCHK